jgi:hypothetical protein
MLIKKVTVILKMYFIKKIKKRSPETFRGSILFSQITKSNTSVMSFKPYSTYLINMENNLKGET